MRGTLGTICLALVALAGCGSSQPKSVEPAVASSSLCAAKSSEPCWLETSPTGCYVWNEEPKEHGKADYQGGCTRGLADGEGVISWANGATTSGTFRGGRLNGRVRQTEADGRVSYEGGVRDGKADGTGTAVQADGRVYVGSFRNGAPDGAGKLTDPKGNVFEGNFRNGVPDGPAKTTYADGGVVEGTYRDGKMDGAGTRSWPNGTTYAGAFRDGKMDGQGTYTLPNGDTYVATFSAGQITGPGTLRYRASGEVLTGTFSNGKPVGEATVLVREGVRYRVTYGADGKQTGTRLLEVLAVDRSWKQVGEEAWLDAIEDALEDGCTLAARPLGILAMQIYPMNPQQRQYVMEALFEDCMDRAWTEGDLLCADDALALSSSQPGDRWKAVGACGGAFANNALCKVVRGLNAACGS